MAMIGRAYWIANDPQPRPVGHLVGETGLIQSDTANSRWSDSRGDGLSTNEEWKMI